MSDGLTFSHLVDLESVVHCDVLCVPGGSVCTSALDDERYLAALRRLARAAASLTSVCTGSLILGAAGVLDGRRAACHRAWRDMLAEFGAIPDSCRVVRDRNIITGGGVTAGIDLALVLIAELRGPGIGCERPSWLTRKASGGPLPPLERQRSLNLHEAHWEARTAGRPWHAGVFVWG